MTAHNWEFDHDVGVLKDNYISNKLLNQAVGETKVAQFAEPFPGVGKSVKNKGETINIMHLDELSDPTSAQLDEETMVPIDKLSIGNRSVKLVPWGRGVEYTNLAEQLSQFKPSDYLQKALMRQMERSLDNTAAAAFKSTDVKICFIPTSLTGGTFDVDGTPSTVATANLGFDHMGVLADYLAGDIHATPFKGDEYIMLACRKTLRGLKQDPLWQDVAMSLNKGELFFRGEVGTAENIRCIQIDRSGAFSNTAGTSTVLGEAVVFGSEAVGFAEAESPHLRIDPNYQSNFGLNKAIAWVGIYVYASIWNTATDGEAKIIRIASA